MKLVKFVMSKAFVERCNQIESPVSKALLNLKKVDFESNSYRNFISVSNDDRSMISFVDRNKEKKLNEVLVNIEEGNWNFIEIPSSTQVTLKPCAFSYYKEDGQWKKGYGYIEFPYLNQKRTYTVTYRTPYSLYLNNKLQSTISCKHAIEKPKCIKNKEFTWNSDIWNPDYRIKTKAGKFIKTLFGNKFTDSEVEYWVNEYQKQAICECGDLGIIKEIQGESIKWAYNENNYYKISGDLGNSCMRYEQCQSYFDIYTENPDKVSLLVMIDNNKVKGRCILWYPNGKTADKKYHDRIYSIDNYSYQCMEVYLKSNNYTNVYNNKNFLFVKFNLDKWQFNQYPYMDSFKYLNLNTGELSTCELGVGISMENTNGSYDNVEEYCSCHSCGDEYHEDDMYYIQRGISRGEYICNNCCTYCSDIEECVNSEDSVYSRYESRSIYHENSIYSGIMRDYIHQENAIELYNGEEVHENWDYTVTEEGHYIIPGERGFKDFVEVNGDWYHIDNANIYYNEETEEYDLIINKKEDELV